MRLFCFAFAALILCGTASARSNYSVEPSLSPVTSEIAGQTLEVRCYLHAETGDPGDYGAWAYVQINEPVVYLSKESCDGALALTTGTVTPLWQLALGALTLTHEAYHLKLSLPMWRRSSEAQTECRAIKRVQQTLTELGADSTLVDLALPWAVAEHFKISTFAGYDYPSCAVPVFKDFWPAG